MLMRGFLQFELDGCAGQSGSKGYAIETSAKRAAKCFIADSVNDSQFDCGPPAR
jgi:hypothetical protein